MEPPALVGFLVDISMVKFPLLVLLKPLQVVFLLGFRGQPIQDPNIRLDDLRRQAQKLLGIGADVVHPVGANIQPQEDIVHIPGKLFKQLVPVADFPSRKSSRTA